MTYTAPIFDSDIGVDGPTYTPQEPGSTAAATPVAVTPAATITPTPATTVTVVAADPAPVPTPRQAATVLPVPVVDGVARFSTADYAGAARALMPRGGAWSTDPAGTQTALLTAIGQTFERIDAEAQALLGGALPGNLTEMLPEWEAALGLPDPCVGDSPTIAQRLDQVRGRFVGAGGQSRQHYIDYAAALGFEITITTYAPFRIGQTPLGQPLAESLWAFVWGVTIVATTGALSPAVLLCELEALKPAETAVFLLN